MRMIQSIGVFIMVIGLAETQIIQSAPTIPLVIITIGGALFIGGSHDE